MKSALRFSMLYFLFLILAVARIECVFAQSASGDDESSNIDELHDKIAKQNAALLGNGLQGAHHAPWFVPQVDPYNPQVFGTQPDVKISKFAPITGFKQFSGSKVIKDVFKELITEPVPVMFQTMMMVENGAATGFIGSMNSVSNLLGNTIQSQQFQMEMFDAVESNNSHKRAYALAVYDSLKEQNKGVWPAALIYASGDQHVEDKPANEFKSFQKHQNEVGSGIKELVKDELNKDSEEYLLSDILFKEDQDLNKFKTDFKEYVGDLKLTANEPKDGSVSYKYEPVQPTKAKENDNKWNRDKELRAYRVKLFKLTKKAWKGLNQSVKDVCEFKKNAQEVALEDEDRASVKIKLKQWTKIQSRDIGVSVNFIEAFFKLAVVDQDLSEFDCNTFDKNGEIPGLTEIQADQSKGQYDDCSTNSSGETCIAKQILGLTARFIAQHKTDWFYRDLSYVAMTRAVRVSEDVATQTNRLICEQVQLGPSCHAISEFESRMEATSRAYQTFLDKFGKFADGQGGSSVFKPGSGSTSGGIGAGS